MIIDTSQKGNILTVSYADENGGISLKEFDILKTNGVGCYDYEICDESDPEKEPILRHYMDNLPIKKKLSWKFDFDEKREFLTHHIPEKDKEDIFKFKVPDAYMCDIEIAANKEDLFPNASEAKFPIDSIQITSKDLRTVTLTCNPRVKNEQSQISDIENKINEHYADIEYVWTLTDRLIYSHICFDTETEMIEFWWKMVNEKLHSVSFWNGDRFDVPYLWNRSILLGINIGTGSPTGEISEFNSWPKHRYVNDSMVITSNYARDLWPLLRTSLEYISNRMLGIGKVKYNGTYSDLYYGPVETFMVYGAVDTISMQLMHIKKRYTVAKEALIFYTKTSMFDAFKVTAQVHALIWDELYRNNLINAVPFEKKIKQPYEGGYVKQPVRKFVMFPVGEDFSALYPRIIQSHNISFENYIGKIKNKQHEKELLEKGYYVSVNGNYYKNDKDYTLKVIETSLLEERYAYKEDLMFGVYHKIMTPIEKEMTLRGIKIN
jgi:DNA polymerase elongation subunit (family B)